jgi:hypothetical protein
LLSSKELVRPKSEAEESSQALSLPSPASLARTIACERSATWSLRKTLETWFLTVF